MQKIDLSHIVYPYGGMWAPDAAPSRSFWWLCNKTGHVFNRETDYKKYLFVDDMYEEKDRHYNPAEAREMGLQSCGMVQMYEGPGFMVVTYHTYIKANRREEDDHIINVLIEDDLLAVEFKLTAPWEITRCISSLDC